jgi:predicted phage terminase large subunit-like protein
MEDLVTIPVPSLETLAQASARELSELMKEIRACEKKRCEENYYTFFVRAWNVLEPETPLVTNWHIRYLCDKLQAEIERIARKEKKTLDLIINIPPRSAKSYMGTIMLCPWAWARFPHMKFINVSYAEELAIMLCLESRRLIESDWYQAFWGDVFQLTTDQNTKKLYENNRSGMRRACATRSVTGSGADVMVFDDPQNPEMGESEVERATVHRLYGKTGYSRLNNQEVGLRLVIQQRLHECLLPTTMVRCLDCQVPIESIRVGDYVLGRSGWQAVVATGNREYFGDVYGVKLYGYSAHETWTTDNHLYLTRHGWVRADELSEGDWVATPAINDVGIWFLPKWESARAKKYKDGLGLFNGKRGTKVQEAPLRKLVERGLSNIQIARELGINRSTVHCAMYYYGIARAVDKNTIDDESIVKYPIFWRVVGYWLAEGSLMRNRDGSPSGCVWTFAKHETDYIGEVTMLFSSYGITAGVEHVKGARKVFVTCRQFAQFVVKHFGCGAHEKRLPAWTLRMPKGLRIELIRGWWRGDGCFCNGDYRGSTVSHSLADDIQLLLQSLGAAPKVFREGAKRRKVKVDNRPVYESSGKVREIRWSAEDFNPEDLCVKPKDSNRIRVKPGWSKVRSIKKCQYSGTVYDITTPSHDFVCGNAVVHNSDLTGHLVDNNPEKYQHICIPAMESDDISPPELRENYTDGLFFPERFSYHTLDEARLPTNLGEYGFSGQMQQNPSPPEGGIFKRTWWRFWVPNGTTLTPPAFKDEKGVLRTAEVITIPEQFDQIIDSWDTAVEGGENHDYWAGGKWGKVGTAKFLLMQIRKQMDYPEGRAAVKRLYEAHQNTSTLLIERSANGPAVKADLSGVVPGLITIPTGKLSKEDRVRISDTVPYAAQVQAGNIYLPHPLLPGCEWVWEYIEEHAKFPKSTYDDQVDEGAQGVNYLTTVRTVWPYFQPMSPTCKRDFRLSWSDYLHYAGVYLSKDMMLNVVIVQWSKEDQKLYVYGALRANQLHARNIAKDMVMGMRLWNLKCHGIVGNKAMFSDAKKDVARLLSNAMISELRRKNSKKGAIITEPNQYERLGAITLANLLFHDGTIVVHDSLNEFSRQASSWFIDGKEPAKEGFGLCEAFCMAVSEVNLVAKIRDGRKKYPDSYRPVPHKGTHRERMKKRAGWQRA